MLEKFYIEMVLIAGTGYVFSTVLIKSNMIFGFWGDLLRNKVLLPTLPVENKEYVKRKRKREKVADLFGLCVYCVTGQMALWYFVLTRFLNVDKKYFEIILFVGFVIFMIDLIKKKVK